MIPSTTTQRARWRAGYSPAWFVVIESCIGGTADMVFGLGSITGLTGRPNSAVYTNRVAWDGIETMGSDIDTEEDGGVAPTGNATVRVAATGDLSSALERDNVFFEGRFLSIYHYDSANGSYTNALRVWSGQVMSVNEVDDELVISAECGAAMYDRKLPPNVYQTENTGVWTENTIPSELEGKAVPMVLGAPVHAEGYTIADTYDTGSSDGGRVIQFADPTIHVDHEISTITSLVFGDGGLVEATGGFAEINTAVNPWTEIESMVNVSFGKIYFDTADPSELGIKLLIRCKSWLEYNSNGGGVTNHRRGIEEDPATFATVPSAPGNQIRSIAYKMPNIGLAGNVDTDNGDYEQCYIFFVGKLDPSASGWTADPAQWRGWGAWLAKSIVNGCFDGAADAICFIRGNAGGEPMYTNMDNWGIPGSYGNYPLRESSQGSIDWSKFSTLAALSQCIGGAGVKSTITGSATGTLDVYYFSLLVHARISWPSSGFFATVRGHVDDTLGTFTGTCQGLIENPVHQAAFLWAICTNAGASNVDSTGAKAVATASRSGWKFSRQILERDDASKHIGELCREAMIWTWIDRDRKVRFFPLSAVGGAVTRLYLGDVLGPESGGVSSVERVRPDQTYSKLTLKYAPNPVTGDYDRSLFCNSTASSAGLGTTYQTMCATAKSWWLADKDRDLDMELNWVEDPATALAIFKKLIVRRTSRPWTIVLRGDIGLFYLEPGDLIALDPDSFTGFMSADAISSTFCLAGRRIDPANDTVELTLVEVWE